MATAPDHTAAFAAYERDVRSFVELNQSLVSEGDALLFPTTADAVARRDAMLRRGTATPQATGRPEHSAFTCLPSPPDRAYGLPWSGEHAPPRPRRTVGHLHS